MHFTFNGGISEHSYCFVHLHIFKQFTGQLAFSNYIKIKTTNSLEIQVYRDTKFCSYSDYVNIYWDVSEQSCTKADEVGRREDQSSAERGQIAMARQLGILWGFQYRVY